LAVHGRDLIRKSLVARQNLSPHVDTITYAGQ
jgi:hypothetical protein